MEKQKRRGLIYEIVDTRKRKANKLSELKYYEGKGRMPDSYVEIAKWKNWDYSYWIHFVQDKHSIIIDSNIIDELYDIIHSYHLLMALD